MTMLTRAASFDRIAERVRAAPSPITLEQAIAGLNMHFRVKRLAIEDGLRERGVILSADDMLRVREEERIGDYARFVAAASQRIQAGDHPLHTDELLSGLDCPDSAIPYHDLADVLRRAGLYHFAGAGWWTAAHWTDKVGNVYHALGNERVRIIMGIMNEYGWPIHAARVSELSGGRIRRTFVDPNHPAMADFFANIGMRFAVPKSETAKGPVPMSPAMAATFLAIEPGALILRKQSTNTYGIAMLLAKHGLATVKKANTKRLREGQTNTVRVYLTDQGRAAITEMARGYSAKALEVI